MKHRPRASRRQTGVVPTRGATPARGARRRPTHGAPTDGRAGATGPLGPSTVALALGLLLSMMDIR